MTPSFNGRRTLPHRNGSAPSENESAVRAIVELANRGLFAQALEYYDPGAQVDLPGGEVGGTHTGTAAIADMVERAIKIYGQPRVRIVRLDEAPGRVFAETVSVTTTERGEGPESHDLHVFEFENGKVRRHQVFTRGGTPALDVPLERGSGEGSE